MFSNYVKVAFRNITRNKLYATINIIGLSMGLALYIFSGLLSDYEHSHDTMFKNHDRTYTLQTIFSSDNSPHASVHSAMGPIIKTDLEEIEAVARTKTRELLITFSREKYYQTVRFADPELLQIFDFEFVYGDATALDSAANIIITETIAHKYFGDENPIGKILTFTNNHALQIGAVIKDAPKNSHFNSNMIGNPLEILVPIKLMEAITGFDPDTNWKSLDTSDLTYVMLPKTLNIEWLQNQMDGIYDRHFPPERKIDYSQISVRPLVDANIVVWDNIGVPALEILKALGYLVLIIACINYTNLATAQSMGRTREIGLRKTLGAGPIQLLTQFIIESMTITIFAMLITLTSLELLIPLFNEATGKILSLNYITTLPWITMVTLIVGAFSGAYPAYLITRINPINALREGTHKGLSSTWVRGLMIGVQFTISVFMLAILLVVSAQNKNVVEGSNIFQKGQIYIFDKIKIDGFVVRQETLRNEILKVSGVENFSFSSIVPFEDYYESYKMSTNSADFSSATSVNQMLVDTNFFDVYDTPLVAGRNFSTEIALDQYSQQRTTRHVLINETAVQVFKFANSEEAIGQSFYEDDGGRLLTYTIVGVVKDQNIYGLQVEVKPFYFFVRPTSYRHASIKLSESATPQTIRDIEQTWKRIIPEYPLQARFLDDWFQDAYKLFDLSAKTLAGFSIFSLILALIGLFGLSAFMAEQRTREIGIRKVLGANTGQIIKLLIWQFSKPVLWAMPFALALAYLASNTYLEFFDDRIGLPYGLLLGAGLLGLILSWVTVATHAFNIARTNPINALHYE